MRPRITTTTFTDMNAIFLDTGYVLALELSKDQNHPAATRHWQSVRTKLPPIVTTSTFAFDKHFTQAGFQKLP